MDAIGLIQRHEGVRLRVYTDTRGKRTIGYGRNLDDVGISHEEALMLLQNDYITALNHALSYSWYKNLTEARQAVIVDMVFNLGRAKFGKFERMIAAIEAGDFASAALEMLHSTWATEVPDRVAQNASIMTSGEWA